MVSLCHLRYAHVRCLYLCYTFTQKRNVYTQFTILHYETGDVFNEFLQYLLFGMSKLNDQEFLDRREWRIWLEDNHSSEKEVWVIIHKKKSGKRIKISGGCRRSNLFRLDRQ